MGDYRPQFPPASSQSRGEQYGDPFADRPRQTQFAEPERPYHGPPSPGPRPFDSTSTLPQDFNGQEGYDDEDYVEKQPLNAGGSFTGGFYPPGYAFFALARTHCILTCQLVARLIPMHTETPTPPAGPLRLSRHLQTVSIAPGDDVKRSSGVLHVRSSSLMVISLRSTQSQRPSTTLSRLSGSRPTRPSSREWYVLMPGII